MEVTGNIGNKSLNEIIQTCSDAAAVFLRFGIDYCCNGKKMLSKVMNELNGDGAVLEAELKTVLSKSKVNEVNHEKRNPDELMKFILDKYHNYFHLNLPLLHEYSQFALKAGIFQPELRQLAILFSELKENTNRHLYKEEHIIFPYIHNLSEAYVNGLKIEIPVYRRIASTRNFTELENLKTHELLAKINKITAVIKVPAGTSQTVLIFLAKLNELEKQICGHLHLMNNVLYPKCEEMEKAVGQHV